MFKINEEVGKAFRFGLSLNKQNRVVENGKITFYNTTLIRQLDFDTIEVNFHGWKTRHTIKLVNDVMEYLGMNLYFRVKNGTILCNGCVIPDDKPIEFNYLKRKYG